MKIYVWEIKVNSWPKTNYRDLGWGVVQWESASLACASTGKNKQIKAKRKCRDSSGNLPPVS